MSKKTEAAKRDAKRKKTRPRQHKRKGRLNPVRSQIKTSGSLPKMPSMFGDPIFMHHVASAILRYLEIYAPSALKMAVPLKDGDTDMAHCEYCGAAAGLAYEASMGLYCESSPTGTHVWKDKPEGIDAEFIDDPPADK